MINTKFSWWYLTCLACIINIEGPSSIASYQDYFKVWSGNEGSELFNVILTLVAGVKVFDTLLTNLGTYKPGSVFTE